MTYKEIYVERLENTTSEPAYVDTVIRVNPGARIITSRLLGPAFLNRNTQVGPDAVRLNRDFPRFEPRLAETGRLIASDLAGTSRMLVSVRDLLREVFATFIARPDAILAR